MEISYLIFFILLLIILWFFIFFKTKIKPTSKIRICPTNALVRATLIPLISVDILRYLKISTDIYGYPNSNAFFSLWIFVDIYGYLTIYEKYLKMSTDILKTTYIFTLDISKYLQTHKKYLWISVDI